jgi:hypothetical protein
VAPGQNYPGQKYVPEATQFGGPVTFQAPLTTLMGIAAGGKVPVIGTVAAGAGTACSISGTAGFDQAGNFTVSNANVTPTAGGTTCSVTFGAALSAAPAAVVVSAANTTSGGTVGIDVGAVALAKTGFSLFMSPLGSVSSYLVNYQVIKAQP